MKNIWEVMRVYRSQNNLTQSTGVQTKGDVPFTINSYPQYGEYSRASRKTYLRIHQYTLSPIFISLYI